MRNTGDIETDYLNGEISLLGRMHGIPTPYNDHLARIAREFVLNRSPGSMQLSEFLRALTDILRNLREANESISKVHS